MGSLYWKLRASHRNRDDLCKAVVKRPFRIRVLSMAGLLLWLSVPLEQVRGGSVSLASTSRQDSMAGLISIRLVPDTPTVRGKGSTQQFAVLASFSDGEERDLSSDTQFSLTNTRVAKLLGSGRIQAVSDGETELVASVGGHRTQTLLRVLDSSLQPSFSFQRGIGGILTRRGCNGRECHGGLKGKGGLKLSVNAAHPREDYRWIAKGGVFQVLTDEPGEPIIPRVNLENPAKSKLLLKPTWTCLTEVGCAWRRSQPTTAPSWNGSAEERLSERKLRQPGPRWSDSKSFLRALSWSRGRAGS